MLHADFETVLLLMAHLYVCSQICSPDGKSRTAPQLPSIQFLNYIVKEKICPCVFQPWRKQIIDIFSPTLNLHEGWAGEHNMDGSVASQGDTDGAAMISPSYFIMVKTAWDNDVSDQACSEVTLPTCKPLGTDGFRLSIFFSYKVYNWRA